MFKQLILSCAVLLDTDEELMEWKTKFDQRIMLLDNKIQKMESNQQDLNNESSAYQRKLET